jgi:peptidoglycan/LPS O-acetylase OafA/YrhL
VLPAYWLALTLLAIWPGLVGPFGEDWYAYYGLLQIYSDAWVLGGIGPAWSLCIEVTFYLLLPFYALGMRRLYADGRERAVRREFAWLGGLAVLSLVIRTLLHVADDGSHFPNTLPGTFFWFALGMGLAVASVALEGREESVGAVRLVIRRPWAAWAAGAALFAFTSYALGLPRGFPAAYGEAAFLAEHILYGLVSLCVLLPAVFGDAAGGWPRRVLANPVLAWLGLISYGIYLWHFTLMSWLSDRGAQEWLPGLGMPSLTLAATAFSVVCAAASYYLVEKPLLRFKDPRPPSRSADSAPSPAAPPRRARLRSPAR